MYLLWVDFFCSFGSFHLYHILVVAMDIAPDLGRATTATMIKRGVFFR